MTSVTGGAAEEQEQTRVDEDDVASHLSVERRDAKVEHPAVVETAD
jgi:hypothetical protein